MQLRTEAGFSQAIFLTQFTQSDLFPFLKWPCTSNHVCKTDDDKGIFKDVATCKITKKKTALLLFHLNLSWFFSKTMQNFYFCCWYYEFTVKPIVHFKTCLFRKNINMFILKQRLATCFRAASKGNNSNLLHVFRKGSSFEKQKVSQRQEKLYFSWQQKWEDGQGKLLHHMQVLRKSKWHFTSPETEIRSSKKYVKYNPFLLFT